MAWYRHLLHLVLAISLLFTFPARSADTILIVGDSQHPPFSYLDNGEPKGIYTDIMRMALDKMQPQDKVIIELYPWKRAIDMVRSGRAKAIFPPHYFPQKRPYLSLYSQPLMVEYASVFCNRATLADKGIALSDSLRWPDDLMQAKFVLSRGVKMGGDQFWHAVEQRQIDVTEVNGPRNAIKMIVNGRRDCHINDRVTVEWYLKERHHNNKDNVALAKIIAEEAGYLATSALWNSEQSQPFIDRFNQQISQMINNGSVQAIIDKYVH